MARVYGLPLKIMNQLSILGKPIVAGALNSVEIEVSDENNPAPQVAFVGTIFQAWADLQNPPDGVFQVSATQGLIDALRPIPPASWDGPVDVALAMQSIATQLGHQFQNSGVDVRLSYPYLAGTGRDQLQQLADAANINWILDENTVAIWPREGSRTDVPEAQISAATGMVGYPIWTDGGVVVKTLYNPGLRFGGLIRITSDLKPANGQWTVYRVDHELESQTPGGRWFTVCEGAFGSRGEEIQLV